jgi:Ala-tRNA(Pro) deacylase
MPSKKLLDYLDAHGAPYEVLHHDPGYTAQETAEATRISGHEFAKTVLLGLPTGHAMAVVPAPRKLDLEKIRRAIGIGQVRLAGEDAMARLCPECEVGAAPPFGNLYDITVFVDPLLARCEHITFNAGTHVDAIRMRYCDYEELVHPQILDMIDEG